MRARLSFFSFVFFISMCAVGLAQTQKKSTSPTSNPKVRAGRKISPARTALPSNTIEPAGNRSIVEIEVRGNRKIERDAILARIHSKVKEPLDLNLVHQDVVDLFNLGYFYNIEVEESPAVGGVKLTYMVTEKPSIGEIKFAGNSDVNEDDLKEAIGIKQFEILNYATIQMAVQKLEKLYEEKGFFLAKIRSKVDEKVGAETVALTFNIEENEKVKVKRITFLGNQKMSASDLKSKIKTSEAGPFSFISGSGAFRQEVFDRDVQILNSIYFNEGFVQVKIAKPEIFVTPDKKHIYITLRIEEGDQFSIGEVDFSGDLLFAREELFGSVKIKKNETFSYEKLVGDINNLQAKYGDKGYAFANILPRTQIREKERLVDITFEFDKGQQVYFGEINITGNTKTRDKVFRRELQVKEGELYNETRKRESLANVKRLGFFDDVTFNQKSRPDDPEKLDVDIDAKERNTGSIQLGAGFSSFQGFIINGQVQQQNLFGLGHRLGVAVDFSERSKIFTLNYTDPFFMDTLWSMGVDVFRTQRFLRFYDEMKEGAALRVGHPLAPYLMMFLRYQNDHSQLALTRVSSQTPLSEVPDPVIFPVDTANGRTSSLTASIEYDKRDDRLMPSDGVFASTSFEYAGLGGVQKYVRGITNARYYKEILDGLVFRNNLTFGFIEPTSDRQVPFNSLFLLGGANTLRGFQWFTVGERKLSQLPGQPVRLVPVGGRQQYMWNTEFEFQMIREAGIRGVVFYDVGMAESTFIADRLRSNYGFGFRWFSPIGPLRFEWGFPTERLPNEAPMNFEFAIGAPF